MSTVQIVLIYIILAIMLCFVVIHFVKKMSTDNTKTVI